MKAAIYCRLSEEDRNKTVKTNDSESIQNQKSLLVQYAIEKGWDVYNIYSDDDYTGSDRNRPSFLRLIDDAENHRFDIVLCKSQSRFTRELEIVEKYIHGLFPIWGIRFISVVDNADTEIKGNKKARQINGLINEWYLEDMSENIKSVLTNRRQNGFHIGAFALYGYKKDPDQKGHLIIDEEAAPIVREIFTLFSKGHGKTAIARMLNDRSVPNPTEYKRLKGLRYQQPKTKASTLWKYFAISDMLTNETYIGNLVQGKYGSVSYKTKINKPKPSEEWIRVEGTHEPIIDTELWNSVQELVKQKAKPFVCGTIGLFSKKAKCMYCGYTMRSHKSHEKHYLECTTKYASKDACSGSFVSVERLEQTVLAELHRLSNEYINKESLVGQLEFCSNLKEHIGKLEKRMVDYKKKIDEYNKGLREAYLDKVKGLISEIVYIEFSREFTKEKEKIEKLIQDTNEQIVILTDRMLSVNDRMLVIESYLNIQYLSREIVEKLIDYISVGKRGKETNMLPVEIHWNF